MLSVKEKEWQEQYPEIRERNASSRSSVAAGSKTIRTEKRPPRHNIHPDVYVYYESVDGPESKILMRELCK
jgi:hypothetical protein